MVFFKRQTIRKRLFHSPFAKEAKEATAVYGHVIEYFEDVLYLLCDIGTIFGSVFFFEKYYDDFGLAGTWIFIITSVINVVLGLHDTYETVHAKKLGLLQMERPEVLESALNVASSLAFAIGCVLGLPAFDSDNFWFDQFFSIIGTTALVVAVYYNSLGMAADKTETLLSRVSLFCTMMGAVMFTVGTTLYLPEIAVVATAYSLGTWLYVWGSVLFTISGILSIVMVYKANDKPGSSKVACNP